MKTYKYRLYPTKTQTVKLDATLNDCRWLYNAALEQRKVAYKGCQTSLNYYDQAKELKNLELKHIHSQVLQDVLKRADKAFQNFFRRVRLGEKAGYPRYKGYNRYDSFTYPQSGFSLTDNKLKLSKIGTIKVKLHRQIKGIIKTCTIKRELNNWYVYFACEVEHIPLPKTNKAVGVDMGLNKFTALSDGVFTANPRYLRQSEAKLKCEQRSLSRKKKGSNSRKKQREKVAKLHRKIRNQRSDFLHKESRKLVEGYDTIIFEDLRIKNMVKCHNFAKSISDASWAKFTEYATYKAESAGRVVRFVNPRNTSQICSSCGLTVKKSIGIRVHKCTCGLILDRDTNAAINILRLGTNPDGVTAVAGL
jgi:putative transposase